jgi:hypothetical protein
MIPMALDERKRQKKLARKAAKRKKALATRRKEFPAQASSVAFAAEMPIHECLIPGTLKDQGIGNVVISRKMPNGDIAAGFFLVDTYCLGVKNCFFAVIPPATYAQKIGQLVRDEMAESVEPACAVKLIQGAVAYAAHLGFHPHKDYQTTKVIFGSINPDACQREFEFGKDGKPFYISGPNESWADSERIIASLTRQLGPDGFHYMVVGELGDVQGDLP